MRAPGHQGNAALRESDGRHDPAGGERAAGH
jgi:hypothetical protein